MLDKALEALNIGTPQKLNKNNSSFERDMKESSIDYNINK
jgi:hypothetical protein